MNYIRVLIFSYLLFIQFDIFANCHTEIDSSTNLVLGIQLMNSRQFDSSLHYLNKGIIEYTAREQPNELVSTLTKVISCRLKSFKLDSIEIAISKIDSLLLKYDIPPDLRYDFLLLKARYYWYVSDDDLSYSLIVEYEDFYNESDCHSSINFFYYKGCTLLSLERFQEAIVTFTAGIEKMVQWESVDSILQAKSLSKIGATYFYLNQIDKAINYNNKSIEIKSKFQNKKSLISSLINGSAYFFAKMNYKDARENLLKAEKLALNYYDDSHPNLANIYNQLGGVHIRHNDFYKGILYLKKAESVVNRNPIINNYELSSIYLNLSSLYIHLKDHEKGKDYFDLYTMMSNSSQRKVEINLLKQIELINLLDNENKFPEFLKTISKREFTDKCILSNIYNEVGEYYMRKNRLEESIKYFMLESHLLKNCQYESIILYTNMNYSLSSYYVEIDSLYLAMEHIDTALTYLTLKGVCPDNIDSYLMPYLAADCLFKKTNILVKLYSRDKEFGHLLEAFDIILVLKKIYDSYRKSYQSDHSKLILAEETYNLYREAVPIAYKLFEHTNEYKYLEAMLLFSESNKSMILLEAVNDLHAKKFSNIPDSLVENERLLRVDIAYYNEKLFYELEKKEVDKDKKFISEMYNKIYQLTERKNKANRSFQKNYPEYTDLKNGLQVPKIEFVKNNLKEDMALIEYFVTNESLFVMLFSDNKFILEKIDYNFDLNSKVKSFKASILNKDFAAFDSLSYQMYQFLIEPIACRIKGKRLIIIPDGHLNYVPFELLTTEKREKDYENYYESKYFFVDHPITYNYSAALYFKGKQEKYKRKAAKNFLGFAPTFGSKFDYKFELALPDGSYKPKRFIELPWAIREVESISKIVKGNVYLKEEATKSNFLKVAKNYNILHLATHAFTHDRFPDYSGLVFASSDSTIGFDNYLHTNELYNLTLNADITVLSACETGVGAEQYGEGLMCLSRGLAYAGCPSMIASKWPLSDQSTARLMGYFYKYVNEGFDKDIALQKARIEFMENMHHFIIPPRFWGALSIIGNEEQIDINPQINYPLIGFTGIVLLALGLGISRKRKKSIA